MKIQHPTKGEVDFNLYDYQQDLINTYMDNRFIIARLPRQSGKTTCAAGFLLWKAMFNTNETILIASHQFIGSTEIMQKIRYAYELLPEFLKENIIEYNKHLITFENGSKIIGQRITEKTGRGWSLSLIYLDEFAFVNPELATEFWTSLAPTLSTGGDCIITSTPNAETDQFAQIWKEANSLIVDKNGVGANGFKTFSKT